jgi:putative oxidoreductase
MTETNTRQTASTLPSGGALTSLVAKLQQLHQKVFATVEGATDGWLTGLLARLVFLAVLFGYFIHSAFTKVGAGVTGFFQVQDGAYFQILPSVMEAYSYDTANVPFFYDLVVYAGTYSEFVLPVMIVLGLFARVAALGMIGFITVQTFVDIKFHGVDATTIGGLFDRVPGSVIADQRVLWVFLLVVIIVKGAGYISLDALLSRWWRKTA